MEVKKEEIYTMNIHEILNEVRKHLLKFWEIKPIHTELYLVIRELKPEEISEELGRTKKLTIKDVMITKEPTILYAPPLSSIPKEKSKISEKLRKTVSIDR